jgi:predicted dehydrogenase
MKVLVVGLGSIARKHIQALKALQPETEILALRSSRTAQAQDGVVNIYSFGDLADHRIDFAIVSNPTSEHKSTLEALLPYSFPLFIEKPLHFSLDIAAVVRKLEASNRLTYVGCNLRFLKCLALVKQKAIAGKRLNEVNIYCGSYLPGWRPGSDYKKSYSAIAALGGGVHLDLIHELDYVYWLFGKPTAVNRLLTSTSSLDIGSVDYANFILTYANFSVSIILNYFRRDPKRSMELVFEDETWQVDLLKNAIAAHGETIFVSEQAIVDTYRDQMDYFIRCVRDERGTFNPVSEAFEVLQICLSNDAGK